MLLTRLQVYNTLARPVDEVSSLPPAVDHQLQQYIQRNDFVAMTNSKHTTDGTHRYIHRWMSDGSDYDTAVIIYGNFENRVLGHHVFSDADGDSTRLIDLF